MLVHGAGQGAWAWGQVWGYLTAPQEHPPRLYRPRRVNVVHALDLPGHGADAGGDTPEVRPEECVHSILRAVEREGLRDLVMVGHGASGGLVLRAAGQLGQPPKRVVLVAGIVPGPRESILASLPSRARGRFRLLSLFSKLFRQDLKLPPSVIQDYLCNDMPPMDVVHSLGFFGLLPARVLTDPGHAGCRHPFLPSDLRGAGPGPAAARGDPGENGCQHTRSGDRFPRLLPPGDAVPSQGVGGHPAAVRLSDPLRRRGMAGFCPDTRLACPAPDSVAPPPPLP